MKMELIEWYDAHSNTGWESQDAYEINFAVDLTIYSVGYVARESGDRVVLLQSYSVDEPRLYDCSLIIPKGCIVNRTVLTIGGLSIGSAPKGHEEHCTCTRCMYGSGPTPKEAREIEICQDSTQDIRNRRRV